MFKGKKRKNQYGCGGLRVAGTRKPPAGVGGPASLANRAAIPDPQEIETDMSTAPSASGIAFSSQKVAEGRRPLVLLA
ncbi:hypothetical protein FS837_004809, partial [Tulasnella sp. UAMH 9824]